MYIILSQDAKSGLRLQCAIAGNASEVAISSYTMAGWQHGSKHAEVWWQCPLSPWEQNQNKWPPFRVDVTVCDRDHEECPQFTNYCSCRTQILSANMLIWKKNRTSATPCQNVQVWNLYGIWKIWFHSIHQIFHSMLGPFHIPYRYFPSIPYSILYHSMPCLTVDRAMSGLKEDESKLSSMLTLCVELKERKCEIRLFKLCSSKFTVISLTRSDLPSPQREHFPVGHPERLVFKAGR